MRYSILIISCVFCFLTACNDEALVPQADNNLKLLIGDGIGDVPISLNILSNGDYLIVSNATILGQAGATVSKIRLIRLTNNGEVVYNKYYPSLSENKQSWSAKTTHLNGDGSIIIGGNTSNQNMLLFNLSENGDSIFAKTDFQNNLRFLDSKMTADGLFVMSTNTSETELTIQSFSSDNLTTLDAFSKKLAIDTVPAASLLVKADTIAFATRKTINYSLWQANEDLDEDARLRATEKEGLFNVKFLSSTPLNNTALGFGEVSINNESKWFSILSGPILNDGAAEITVYDQSATSVDVLNNINVEEEMVLLCGARRDIGPENVTDFLLMSTNHDGKFNFSRRFGSTSVSNELHDAIIDMGQIVALGTTVFDDVSTIVIIKLSLDGRLIK